MLKMLSVSDQFRTHRTTRHLGGEQPDGIRVIPVAKLQSELCAVMNLTSDLATHFYASNRGIVTHAIIPVSAFGCTAEEFVSRIEALVPARFDIMSAREGNEGGVTAKTARPPESFLPELQTYDINTIELVKQNAHRKFAVALSVEDRAMARMTVARCHHERSLRFAEENGRGERHPSFEVFMAHYLAASSNHEDPDVLGYLQERYPPPEVSMIKPGDAYWRH